MTSSTVHGPKARPDPRPMRLALGAAGLAAFSAIATAIVMPARPVVVVPDVDTSEPQEAAPVPTGTPVAVQQPVQYVQLLPGQTAPPGATVIDPDGPLPTAVVVTVPAPAPARAAARKPIVVKTTQSGKVIP